MLLYHFLSEEHAKDDIINRKLKTSSILDVNDPFEFLNFNLSNHELRPKLEFARMHLNNTCSFVSFSKSWNNPVLWSHYADKHKGVSLGFEINDRLCQEITYSRTRIKLDPKKVFDQNYMEDMISLALRTKYIHWIYENEVRIFVDRIDTTSALHYTKFDDEMALKEVILGCRCGSKVKDYTKLVKDYGNYVKVIRARMSLNSYEIIQD